MDKIGGGGVPPKGSGTSQPVDPADLTTKQGVQQFKEAAGKQVPQKVVDSFQRAGGAIEARLQTLSGPALAQRLNFTNTDLALMARAFAAVLRDNPNADRLARSKLFAKTVLKNKGVPKHSRMSQLLDDANEENSESDRQALQELYEMIAQQLESTPVLAQLVDEVTESARKIR